MGPNNCLFSHGMGRNEDVRGIRRESTYVNHLGGPGLIDPKHFFPGSVPQSVTFYKSQNCNSPLRPFVTLKRISLLGKIQWKVVTWCTQPYIRRTDIVSGLLCHRLYVNKGSLCSAVSVCRTRSHWWDGESCVPKIKTQGPLMRLKDLTPQSPSFITCKGKKGFRV